MTGVWTDDKGRKRPRTDKTRRYTMKEIEETRDNNIIQPCKNGNRGEHDWYPVGPSEIEKDGYRYKCENCPAEMDTGE